jgi:hypothetical protein
MKMFENLNNCWHRLLPMLAALLAQSVFGQGIVYVKMPPTIRSTNQVSFPEDALGTYVGDPLSILINGQTILTFSSGRTFSVNASSTSAIIGQQPFGDFPDDIWVVPLSAGQEIGSDAASFNWFDNGLLASSTASDTQGGPPLTAGYFAGVESAYMGFNFQQGGQTYYGWIQLGSPYAFGTGGQGWIYDYAYETTPNTSIFAGAVPEPSTMSLCILGTSLIFLLRKKACAVPVGGIISRCSRNKT